jgi:serine/threonine-protein kinase PRP4
VKNNNKTVKICDFGTAFKIEEYTPIELLASRYYRAPEVIIGYYYDTSIDVWAIACTLFELYTGKFLFPGKDNNEMLKLIM